MLMALPIVQLHLLAPDNQNEVQHELVWSFDAIGTSISIK